MASRTRLIALLLGGAAVLVVAAVWFMTAGGPKPGTWPASDRAAFMRSCVDQCRASPGMTLDRYPVCESACNCAADEGEKTMTVEELASAGQAVTAGQASPEQTAKMDRLKTAGMKCVASTTPAKQ